MKSFLLLLIQIALFNFFADAGNITNQVVKTKGGHTCVLPTVVDKATSYWFLSNPQPGEIFEYCTVAYTDHARKWPWCSYGKSFPEVENGVETFKWDYCTEYSWEYEGFRYSWKESTNVKSSYEDAKKFCNSTGGSLPHFNYTKEREKEVLYRDRTIHFIWWYIEKTPVFEGELKTAVTEALRPLLAFYEKSSKRGFWMLTEPTVGTWTDINRSTGGNLVWGRYVRERCLTIHPHGVATMSECGKHWEDFADVLCQYKI